MQIKRLLIVSLLALAMIMPGCKTGKVNTDPSKSVLTADDVLRGAKTTGRVVAVALDEGITLEATLATNGTIDKEVEPQIKQWLQDGKKAVADFNVRIGKYDHLDADSKKVIADFLDEALGFISNLNANGILRIKNTNSQLIAAGILSGASLALTLYKETMFNKVE